MVVMIAGSSDSGLIEVYSPDGRCSQAMANRPSSWADPALGYINEKITACSSEGRAIWPNDSFHNLSNKLSQSFILQQYWLSQASRYNYFCSVKILNLYIILYKYKTSGLSWKTEIYRPKDLRLGSFSIHLSLQQCNPTFLDLMPWLPPSFVSGALNLMQEQ